LSSLAHFTEEDQTADSQIHQRDNIDQENEAQKAHGSVANLPLRLGFHSATSDEKEHQVLHGHQAKLIEVLETVMNGLCVGPHERHVPEVARLEPIKGDNEPNLPRLEC